MDASIGNIVAQTSLKWIFVGGKGGVGKTTTSAALAVELARTRPSVLIISTDPAHNLSDAFGQKFTGEPTAVAGFANLFAMEVDAAAAVEKMAADGSGDFLGELSLMIPGIDEAMGFAEVMKLVQAMDYAAVVFDTAPTGHTLRFLSFPTVLERGLAKLGGLSSQFAGVLQSVPALLGLGGDAGALVDRLGDLRAVVAEVNRQFRDPQMTTFVCVCIAEFLSLYETERLVQELSRTGIDAHNVVVNQLVAADGSTCPTCIARARMQGKYLAQIDELYADFHVTRVPMLTAEVRGRAAIESFARLLTK